MSTPVPPAPPAAAPPPGIPALGPVPRVRHFPVVRLALACMLAVLILLAVQGRLPASGSGLGAEGLILLGLPIAFTTHHLAQAALAGRIGLAWTWAQIGAGARLTSFVLRGRYVAVRPIPVTLFAAAFVPVDRPGLRRRLWLGAVLIACAHLGAGVALLASGQPAAQDIGWGVLTVTLIFSFGTRVTPGTRTWFLLRLPSHRSEAELAELAHDPALLPVLRAIGRDDIPAARAALDAAPHSGRPTRLLTESYVALADERYAEAAQLASAVHDATTVLMLRALATSTYADALGSGALAGVWPADAVRPAFDSAVADLRATVPELLKSGRLAAIRALLRGVSGEDVESAVRRTVRRAPTALAHRRGVALR